MSQEKASPAPKFRIGLIGAGAIAQTYAQVLTDFPLAHVVGVVDTRAPAAEAMAERLGCPAFASHEQLCAQTECDVAVLCTPPVTHPEIAEDLLAREIHVLCEKPLAIDVAGARRMLAAKQRSRAALTMASKFRHAADVIQAHSLVASGVIGDVVLIENAFTARVDMTRRWNSDPLISGGGVLIDNGTHSVDILRYFLGPLDEIQAIEGKRIQDIQVEDTARVFLRSRAGVMGSIDLSWSLNKELPYFLSVYGSSGTLHVGWKESKYRRSSDADWTVFGKGYDKLQSFRGVLENFLRSLQGLEPPRITLADGLASVEAIDAAYKALWGSTWVPAVSELSSAVDLAATSG